MMDEQFILIKNLTVYDVSGYQNTLVIGSPSPATFCLSMVALCRNLDVNFCSVAYIMHRWDFNQGHYRFVPHEAKDKTASTSDLVQGEMDVSLIIGIEREIGRQSASCFEDQVRLNLKKVANGRVIDAFSQPTHVHLYDTEEDVLREAKRNQGFIMIDRSDLLVGEPLQAVIDNVAIQETGTKKGWIVPIHVGFQGIELPNSTRLAERKRLGLQAFDRIRHRRVGDTTPHLFGECMTSLGEYRSIRKIKTLRDTLWNFHYNPREGTYYVAAR